MGLFDRFKKEPDSENRNNSETPDGTGNYRHFVRLLISAKYVDLDCDIAIGGGMEKRLYKHGLPVFENTIVDGNGHIVDARGIGRIFFIRERNIVIKNMTFINGSDIVGGAIVIDENASVEIRDCTFKGNRAKHGGAIINSGSLSLENVKFIDNSSEKSGGVINNQSNAELSVINCSFRQNSANNGGAIINSGSLSLENVKFIDNSSEKSGGVINNQSNAELSVINCSFRQNSANKHGGALMNKSERPLRISNTEFIRNSSSAEGGAINNNGNSANMIIDDSRFAENRSGVCGGAIINWGDFTIRNSQFQGNFSKSGNHIYCENGSMHLSNSRFDYPKESSIFLANEDLVNIEDCEFAPDEE